MKPKRIRPALAGALLLSIAAPVGAQTLLLNFGANAVTDDPGGQTWNLVNATVALATPDTPAATLAGLLDNSGAVTGSSLVMLSRFNGLNTNGTQASAVIPPSASRDSFFGNTESFGAGTNFFPSFKITGLATGVSYSLTFYGSRTGATDNRETDYTVAGATTATVSLNPAGNIDGVAVASGIQPDASGEIIVSIGPGANNGNGNHFTYLGAMKVETASTDIPVGFSAEPQDVTVLQGRATQFTATATGTPPYTIEWLLNGQPIPGEESFTLNIPEATLDLNGGLYSVRVSNGTSTKTSTQAKLTVTPDTEAPTLVSAVCGGPWAITLVFSEEMEEGAAIDINNYTLNAGAVSLNQAALRADRRTVVLTPLEALPASVVLQFGALTDIIGNAFVAASDPSFTVPQPDGKSFLFDFGDGGTVTDPGPAPDDPLNLWNNIPIGQANFDGAETFGLRKNDGMVTDLGLTVVSRFNGANTNGTTDPTAWAVEATRDSLYGNTESFNNLENIAPVFKIKGLPAGQLCDFEFYASRMGVSDNRETVYTVTGANTGEASLNVSNNVSGSVTVSGIAADAAGEISIALTPGASNNNANHFVYLAAMKLTLQDGMPAPVLLTPELDDGVVTLRWSGAGALETATDVNGPWTPVVPAPSSPWTDGVSGQRKFYRLRYTP